MEKLNLIILAGGEKGPLYDTYGYENKALLPVHGKPMLDWVVDAFRETGLIDKIVVVGPKELDKLQSMRFVDKRVNATPQLVQNILRGIAYVRWTYYRHKSDHPGYIISFCDAVFLTPEAIKDAVKNIKSGPYDVALHYIEKETFEKNNIHAKRTYIPVDGKYYTGSTIYYVRKFSNLLKGLHLLGDLRKNRKDPQGLLRVMGLENKSFDQIQSGLSERLGKNVGIFISDFPGMGMDVDKESDFEAAQELLSQPWQERKRIKVILNGNAGSGYHLSPFARRLLRLPAKENISKDETHRRIKAAMESMGLAPEFVWTDSPGHATALASEAAKQNYDVVVAVGGDGTINEVVNGLAKTDTRLGIIPTGTANLLATEMGIPPNIEAACQIIAKGSEREIDTATVNGRHFTVMAGIGFDAHVVSQVDSQIKSKWGALAYPLVALREIVRYPFRRIKVKTQDGLELRAFFVFVQNAKIYASGFALTPDSRMDDGSLEVLMFPTKNILSLILYLLSSRKHKYCLEMKGVKLLEINSPHAIQIDGDYACKGPATIRIEPGSLKIITDFQG